MVAVSTLIERAKQRCDMVNRNFVTSATWVDWASSAYKELYDLLLGAYGEDYYMSSTTLTVSSGNSVSLPATFYKMRGLDDSSGCPLKPYNFNERNSQRRGLNRFNTSRVRYRIQGGSIVFTPNDQALGSYTLWYVPLAASLSSTSDTIDGINGWEDFIVHDMCINAAIKEETDPTPFQMKKAEIKERIEAMAVNRDLSNPGRVVDVYASDYDDPFYNV